MNKITLLSVLLILLLSGCQNNDVEHGKDYEALYEEEAELTNNLINDLNGLLDEMYEQEEKMEQLEESNREFKRLYEREVEKSLLLEGRLEDRQASIYEVSIALDSEEDYLGFKNKEYYINRITQARNAAFYFEISSPNYDPNQWVDRDGARYYKVTDSNLDTYDKLESMMNNVFVSSVADRYLGYGNYINENGELYTRGGEAGTLVDKEFLEFIEWDEANQILRFSLGSITSDGYYHSVDHSVVEMVETDGEWYVSRFDYGF